MFKILFYRLEVVTKDPFMTTSLLLKTVYMGIDHHWKEAVFATCGQQVDIWDEQRSSPICSMTWGFDSICSVKFNPIEVMFLSEIYFTHCFLII